MVKKAAYLSVPLLAALAAILIRNTAFPFLFPCIFHEVTGFYCMGCGGTRAVFSLLEGDILKALGYNAFFVLLLPFLVYFYLAGFIRTFFHKELLPMPKNRTPWLWSLLGFAVVFTVVRNIAVFPFTLLKP